MLSNWHRRPGRVHVTLEHWLLSAGTLFFTVLTIAILLLVVFVSRAV